MTKSGPLAAWLLVVVMATSGCGSTSTKTVTVTTPQSGAATDSRTTTGTPTPPQPAAPNATAEHVVDLFRAHGLTTGKAAPMTPQDYGAAPVVAHGVHFFIPRLDAGAGGRAFSGSIADLAALKHYYDSLGKSSGLLFSWTFLNARRHVLVQLNGDLPKQRAMQYASVVRGL
jgi:hypothetical protein